jgi:hypothetical protein
MYINLKRQLQNKIFHSDNFSCLLSIFSLALSLGIRETLQITTATTVLPERFS